METVSILFYTICMCSLSYNAIKAFLVLWVLSVFSIFAIANLIDEFRPINGKNKFQIKNFILPLLPGKLRNYSVWVSHQLLCNMMTRMRTISSFFLYEVAMKVGYELLLVYGVSMNGIWIILRFYLFTLPYLA